MSATEQTHEQPLGRRHLQPRHDIVVPGETMPAVFWNAPRRGRQRVLMRQKELGIWRELDLGADGRGRARDRRRPARARLRAPATAPRSCPTPSSNGCSPTSPCSACGGVSNGIYPTDAPAQVEYLLRRLAHARSCSSRTTSSSTRRSRCARSLPRLAQDRRLRHWKACAISAIRAVHALDRAARARRAATARRIRRQLDAARRRVPARGPRDPGLHLGHDRQAQGRDALARRHRLHRSAATTRSSPRTSDDERMCFLPLCHIAERVGGEYFAVYTGSVLNFVENPETVPENVREIAPTVLHRRAAHLGEVLFERDDRDPRSRAALQQAAYALGDRRRPPGRRARRRRPAGRRGAAAARSRSRAGSRSTTCAS